MPKLTNTSIDKLLIGACLLILFVAFPIFMYVSSRSPKANTKSSADSQPPAQDGSTGSSDMPQLPLNSEPPPIDAGTRATDFASTTVGGKSFVFDSQSPHIKIVDFWATWCGPCKMSIPTLEAIDKSLRSSGVQTIGVSVDTDTAGNVLPYTKAMGMDYTVLVDPKKDTLAANTYNATGLPSLYIIDGKGIVRWSYSGYWPDEESYIRRVIADIQAGKSVDY